MSTHEDRWLEAKLTEAKQRREAVAEEAARIRKRIRDARERGEEWPRITPEANEWDYSEEGQAFIDEYAEVDTRGGLQLGRKED